MTATHFCSALVVAAAVLSPAAALAERSDYVPAERSQLRLLLSPETAGANRLSGGIDIVLEPGWYTYWRNPGEAGIPPIFDFSGSVNVAAVEVSYPIPERHDDGMSVSAIYQDEVVFPLAVTPVEAGRPVTLRLDARYGVCREVCIPTGATAEVMLPQSPSRDPLTTERLRRFAARVPQAADPGRFAIEEVTASADAVLVDVRMPEASNADLFADPPSGWFVGAPALLSRSGTLSRYRLAVDGRPQEAGSAGESFRFVAVAGAEAIEQSVPVR